MTKDLWIIAGASSAIARAFTRQLAQDAAIASGEIWLCGRDGEDLDHIARDLRTRFNTNAQVQIWDAERTSSNEALARQAVTSGRRVHLFWAAGLMADEKDVQVDPTWADRMMQVNARAAEEWVEAMTPTLARQSGNHLIFIGSVAGDRIRAKNASYGRSKMRLHAYAEFLRQRLPQAHVLLAKPGFVDTAMTWGRVPFAAAPETCAKRILFAMKAGWGVVYVPGFWRIVIMILRAIPEPVFKRLPI